MTVPDESATTNLRDDYLALLKASLSGRLAARRPSTPMAWRPTSPRTQALQRLIEPLARRAGITLTEEVALDERFWDEGYPLAAAPDRAPLVGDSMVGRRRLDQLHAAVEQVCRDGVPGDLIETGVWRGGSSILMKAVLRSLGEDTRRVYLADSFQGLPPPDTDRYPADTGSTYHELSDLAVSVDAVRARFEAYGLLDARIEFVEGWFRDTLPGLRNHRWALIRLDGDLYESTMDGLENLYDGLSPGGVLIVDDYGAVPGCKTAVDEFRAARGIEDPIVTIDWTGVYWVRSS